MTGIEKRWIGALMGVVVLVAAAAAAAQGPRNGRASLEGIQEVPTIISTGTGTLQLSISPAGNAVAYTLSYRDLEGAVVQQAHIHLGKPLVNGGIMVWLCGSPGFAPPMPAATPPACPPPSGGTVSGVVTPLEVVGPSGQGVAPGEFDEFLAAIRAGITYANVHTNKHPPGEIRGQVTFHAHGAPIR